MVADPEKKEAIYQAVSCCANRRTVRSKDIGPIRALASCSLERLLRYVETQPSVSLDPNDIKAHPWFLRRIANRKRFLSSVALRTAYLGVALFPRTARRLLKIQPQQTPGAVAWLAQAYIQLSHLTKTAAHKQAALFWLSQMKQLRVPGIEELAWGLPFDLQGLILYPANSPLLYTTWQAAQAFYDHYRLSGDSESLEVALSTCHSMKKIFNRAVDDPQYLCLTYAPYDEEQVYNVNALAGGLCCQLGVTTSDKVLLDLGFRMLNWVVDGQAEDGSWEYFSRDFKRGDPCIDHFHTAMTLQGLVQGSEAVGEESWKKAIELGLDFYLREMFDQKDRPKYFQSKTFPIENMSCAEGIILLSRLQQLPLIGEPLREAACTKLRTLVHWTCINLQAKRGYFYWRKYPFLNLSLWSYRWGQGAMLKALASFLNNSG